MLETTKAAATKPDGGTPAIKASATDLPWPARSPRAVLLAAVVCFGVASAVAAGLSVRADLSLLLPAGSRSVRELAEVQRRAQTFGSLLVVVEAQEPEIRAAAARELLPRLQRLDPSLVASVVSSDLTLRKYLWDNRHLFASLDQLVEADEELRRRLARLNPLYVDLDDGELEVEVKAKSGDAQRTGGASDPLQALQRRLVVAKTKASGSGEMISPDGRLQMFIVRARFPSADVEKSRALADAVHVALAAASAAGPPRGLRLGATGDIITVVIEQESIVRGMVIAAALTTALVCAGLLLYFRSVPAVLVILLAVACGTTTTFAFARLAIGYLNSATAFLIAIVIGNGINFPILLVARYLEQRRNRAPNAVALAAAWSGTARGTIAAAGTAAIAYGSLILTDFRGFRHFGIIGGVGMLLCWAAAYAVVPAALHLLDGRGWFRKAIASTFDSPPARPLLARLVAGAFPERPKGRRRPAALFALVLVVVLALAGGVRYLSSDPFEYDLQQVRSTSPAALMARQWQRKADAAFGRGIAGGMVFAVDRREDAAEVARRLRELTVRPGAEAAFSRVASMDDLVPTQQPQKLELLAGIRRLIDRHATKFTATERERLMDLRPPDGLVPLTDKDVPPLLALQFTEKDGAQGRLIFANTSRAVNTWDGRQLARLSREVRATTLPPNTRVAGNALVFADIVDVIRRDGPRTTALAALGVVAMIALTVGLNVHGALTAGAALLGTLAMLALAGVVGLKVNFLDFVALPLTLGIGVDYAANVLTRARQEAASVSTEDQAVRRALLTTGGAVLLCSYTTIVGYVSLLVSSNAGIRSFGTAAMLGELTCLCAGLWAAPLVLSLAHKKRARRPRGEQSNRRTGNEQPTPTSTPTERI